MTTSGILTDQELVVLLKEGNRNAFTEIYNRYWPPLFLHVRRMLSDDDRAQDIVQELFTLLWQRFAQLDFTTSLSSYLYTSVRNRVFNEIKHEKVKANRLDDMTTFLQKGHYEADEALRYKELVNAIESEIERMPEKMREIFELSRNQDLSHKEIAAKLNLSEHTVRKQIQRALKLLRVKLNVNASALIVILHLLR